MPATDDKIMTPGPAQPPCAHPWFSLLLYNTGRHAPCCVVMFGREGEYPASGRELFQAFNSPEMVRLRRRLASGDLQDTPCAACLARGVDHLAYVPELAANPALSDMARLAFKQGKAELDYPPAYIQVNTSTRCNLRCRMCIQSPFRDRTFDKDYPVAGLMRAIEEQGFENLAKLELKGGEALHTRDGLDMLQFMADRAPERTELFVTTNAQLIPRASELLSKIPRLRLACSVDGHRESYEHIRAGGTWEGIERAVAAIEYIRNAQPKAHIEAVSLVMGSSLPDLPHNYAYLSERFDGVSYYEICEPFALENIFLYPSLLYGMNFQEPAQRALDMATAREDRRNAAFFSKLLSKLESLFFSPGEDILLGEFLRVRALLSGSANPSHIEGRMAGKSLAPDVAKDMADRFLGWIRDARLPVSAERIERIEKDLAGLDPALPIALVDVSAEAKMARAHGKRLAIWGTGGNYRMKYRDLLLRDRDRFTFVGFIDNNPEAKDKDCDGFPVHGPEILGQGAIDCVLIASVHHDEISRQIVRSAGDAVQII